MDVKVARFRCKHPKCTGNSTQKNDFSIQTIYEHVAQHLHEDTQKKDHFNLGCSCSGKVNFSLLPYATWHLNQFRKEPHKHTIICNKITQDDVLSSRRILCYQKRFVEFKEYKIEKDDCPDLTVYPVDTVDVPQYAHNPFVMPGSMVMPNGMHIPNFNMFGSGAQGNGARTPVRGSSPVGARTPVFSRSPARDDYSPPPYNSRRSPGPSSGRRSPPRDPRGMTPSLDTQRRDSGRYENRGFSRGGYRGDGGVSGGFGREDAQSPDEHNRKFHGRGRGNYRGRGGSGWFGREDAQSPDEHNRKFHGRGRGNYSGFGRDSEGFNGGRGGSASRNQEKRVREAASPRSSDDETPAKRNAHGRKSVVSNERGSRNSNFGGRGMDHNSSASTNVPFNTRRGADDTQSSGIRPRADISPRSSDDD